MKLPAIIHVKGNIIHTGDPASEAEKIETKCKGTVLERDGNWFILYDDPGEEEKDIVHNRIIVAGDHVTVQKRGAIVTDLTFVDGRQLDTLYHTPYGDTPLTTRTDSVLFTSAPNGVVVHLKYRLGSQGQEISRNELYLQADYL